MPTENNNLGYFYGTVSVYWAIPNGIDRAKFSMAPTIAGTSAMISAWARQGHRKISYNRL
jgi:hypothetical protein